MGGYLPYRHTSLQNPLVDLGLSTSSFAEQLRLIFGGLYLQEVSLVTALEQTSTSFGILDEVELGFFKLKRIDIISCVDVTAVEEELVSRNRLLGVSESTSWMPASHSEVQAVLPPTSPPALQFPER